MNFWNNRPRPSADQLLDRAPPHSLEAESGFLCSIMLDPSLAVEAIQVVQPKQFYSPNYKKIFEAMIAMVARGMTIDVAMLTIVLKEREDFDAIGGSAFILDIIETAPTSTNWNFFAQTILNTYRLREIIHSSSELLRDAYDGARGEDVVPRSVDKLLSTIATIQESTEIDHRNPFTTTFEELEHLADKPEEHQSIPTDLQAVNDLIGGLFPRELVIIGARPSMGKSALAQQIAEYAAQVGNPTLFASIEMSRQELTGRMMASRAGVSFNDLRQGKARPSHVELVREQVDWMKDLPIFIDDRSSQSVGMIAAMAKVVARKFKRCGLIVVDYLQYVEPEDQRSLRAEQIAKITRALKRLARELNIPVVALSQIARSSDKEKDNRPKLSNLRESGAIEQDADSVILIHREEYYRKDDWSVKGKAEIIVAKNRHGPTGTAHCLWNGRCGRFFDIGSRDPNAGEVSTKELFT